MKNKTKSNKIIISAKISNRGVKLSGAAIKVEEKYCKLAKKIDNLEESEK